MTYAQFIQACNSFYIDPDIAMENEDVVKAVQARDLAKLLEILEEEF